MLRAYKYRILPTESQRQQIEKHFGSCRLVWNLALAVKTQAWDSNKVNVSRYDLQKQLIGLKDDYSWLYDINAQSLQSVLFNLDNSYKRFFSGCGFPRFKSKSGRQSFSCPGNKREIDFKNSTLTIPKIKGIPIVVSREFNGSIRRITISKEPTGKYYASVLVDTKIELPVKAAIGESSMIGVDLGLKDFAILSNGEVAENPRHYRSGLKRLKCLQRRLSRKKKGGNKRKKAKLKLVLQHEKIKNQRKDFLHKLSSAITKQYDSVCVEDLAVKNMVRNRKLSQAISDVGWGEFLRQLKYKCDWYGKNYLEVPRFFASSKTCSDCNSVNETLTLVDREWTCANCGAIHDRDINAAKNIKQYFLTNSGEGISDESVELLPIGKARKREASI